jgi:uncharacterized protein (DUF885 family)
MAASFAAIALSACAGPAKSTAAPDALAAEIIRLANQYVAAFAQQFPEYAEFAGLAEAPHDRLSDNSLAAVAKWRATEDRFATELARIDRTKLWGRPEWTIHGLFRESLEASRGSRVCRTEFWPVSQLTGWQATMAKLADMQPVGTPKARADALARWKDLPRYLSTEMGNLREGLRAGFSTPRRNVELVVAQLDALLAPAPRESPLFGPAKRDGDAAFAAALAEVIEREITPAIRRYRDFLRDEYAPRARTAIAVTAHPDGLACYRAEFRSYTSLDRPPEETFRLGEQRVAQNMKEAVAIGREAFGLESVAKIQQRVRDDPANRFATRQEVLQFARDAVERSRKAIPRWFGRAPEAPIVVEPHPTFVEASASDQYLPPSADGSRPGTYRIKLYKPEDQLRSQSEITAFHEAYPGHHLQISLALEKPAAHPITRLVGTSSFTEGWARYAEALSEEMRLYSLDHARISRRMWPSRGMVVDPGIHVLGWSREQAIDYIRDSGRFAAHEAESLVDRIVMWPGQLTAYDTGALELFALRQRAEKQLGGGFDIRVFHDRLLENGSLTLEMARETMDRWLSGPRQER